MEIKVTFRFDASDSLLACVDKFREVAETLAQSGLLSQFPANKEEGIVKAIATEDGVTVNKKEQIWPPKGEQEGAEAADAADAAEAAEEKVPTVADMRKAVSRARERIEGSDWEDKTSEGYKTWHKKVTSAVKIIVGALGAGKIPDIAEDKRAIFIQCVDDLEVLKDDSVGTPEPF